MNRVVFLALLGFATPLFADEGPIRKTADGIEFRVGNSLVTRYHFGEKVAKPYLFPLLAKGDIPTTRAWPMKEGDAQETKDHIHQKSAWFCHGDVIPHGIELKAKIKNVDGVDFWSETPGHGRIVCVAVEEPKGNAIVTRNEWRTAEGVKILDENRTLSLLVIGDNRLIVLEIELIASVCPITFGDTKEGSMGVRVHDRLRVEGGAGMLANSLGQFTSSAVYKTNRDAPVWGLKADWCDYTGKVQDQEVGIALLDDPKNPIRASWHARGYGLMAANPFGRDRSGFPSQKGNKELVKLDRGETLKLRYGILLHPGDTRTGKVAESFDRFCGK